MKNTYNDFTQNQNNKVEVKLEIPYTLLGKDYNSLNQLFLVMIEPQNYRTAIEEWKSGKLIKAIKQVDNSSFKSIYDKILDLDESENGDKDITIKSQFGLVSSLLNPYNGFVVDGVEVTVDSLKNFINYFFFFQKNTMGEKELMVTKISRLLIQILENSKLANKLKVMNALVHRYNKILSDYENFTEKEVEGLDDVFLNLNEKTLKNLEWMVITYTDLIRLADSKNLILDKDKAVQNISKFKPVTSLVGINKQLNRFKKKYRGAKENWTFLYNQDELSDKETLLLLSAPEKYLVINQSYRMLMTLGVWLIILLSMFGLIVIPYFIVRNESGGSDDIAVLQWIGSDRNDQANDVKVTEDGSILISGYTSGFGVGKNDIWTIKMDVLDKLVWSKTVGGGGNDIANVIALSRDQGFYIGGWTSSLKESSVNSLIVKFDSSGTILWSQVYDIGVDSKILGLTELSYGGLAIVGQFIGKDANSKLFILMSHSDGKIQWYKKFNDNKESKGIAAIEGMNQEIIILAKEESHNQRNLIISSYSKNGNLLWQKSYFNFDLDHQKLVLPLPSGILFAGKSIDPVENQLYVDVIKVDYSGNHLWDRRITDKATFQPVSLSIVQNGEGYFLMGETFGIGQTLINNFYIFKDNGNFFPLETDDNSTIKNSVWGILKNKELVLVGIDDNGRDRQQDVWMMKKKVTLSQD